MSGANRPAGPATPKSRQLAEQISRDEMEHNLPDALWGRDEDSDSSEPPRGARTSPTKGKAKSRTVKPSNGR
jgi:hypothetical protein